MVLAIFTLVTGIKKTLKVRFLDQVPYICYPMELQKDKGKDELDLFNLGSRENAIILTYTAELSFKRQRLNIKLWKIDGSSSKTYSIVIAIFQILDKISCS